MLLKQNTACTKTVNLGATGLTPTVTASANGAAFAAISGSITEIGNNWYALALAAADTATLGSLAFNFSTGTYTEPADQVVVDLPGASVSSVTGNVAGSVASVTGAVGSVTGDVNGNVVGHVASVAGGMNGSVGGNVNGNVLGSIGGLVQGATVLGATASGGTSTTITLNGGSSHDNFYVGCPIWILSGTGAGQCRIITAFDHTTTVATVDNPWVVTPDNTSVYSIQLGEQSSGGGDPWATDLPGSYTAGQAGYILGGNLGAVASVTGAVGSVTSAVTVSTNNDKTGYALSTAGIDALFTTQLTESYNSDGRAPTLAQALFLIISFLMEKNISGLTVTCKQLDGSTTSSTFTLNDATTPTTITRSS